MAFFDKIGDFAKSVGDKTSSAIEAEKLKSKIKNENARISELHRQAGQIIWAKYVAGAEFDEEFSPIFAEITACSDAIDAAEAELQAIREAAEAAKTAAAAAPAAGIVCLSCGNANAPGTRFCSKCGVKLAVPEANVCPACGASLAPGAKFCPSCGTKTAVSPLTSCPDCGNAITPETKFCPGCGKKLS